MPITLYGLKNCDTCRTASQWLSKSGLTFEFVDIRQDGVVEKHMNDWLESESWGTLLNRRSRTWRELTDADRDNLDAEKARKLMLSQPTLIKRPVLEHAGGILVGFSAARYETALAGAL